MVPSDMADQSKDYVSYSHGVFLRNAHGQEILTHPDGLTWRTLDHGNLTDQLMHAFEWCADELNIWHGKVPFDGIWIDMSEF